MTSKEILKLGSRWNALKETYPQISQALDALTARSEERGEKTNYSEVVDDIVRDTVGIYIIFSSKVILLERYLIVIGQVLNLLDNQFEEDTSESYKALCKFIADINKFTSSISAERAKFSQLFMQAAGVDIKNFSDRTRYNKLDDNIKSEIEQMIEAGFGEAEDLLRLFTDSSKQ